MFEQVVQVGDRLARVVDALDPDRVAGPDAERLWGALDRVERLASAGKSRPATPAWTSWTPCATTTTPSRPATAGR